MHISCFSTFYLKYVLTCYHLDVCDWLSIISTLHEFEMRRNEQSESLGGGRGAQEEKRRENIRISSAVLSEEKLTTLC